MNPTKNMIEPKLYMNLTKNLIELKLYMWFIVFRSIFNDISDILLRLVLLVEETGIHGENYRPGHKSLTNFIT